MVLIGVMAFIINKDIKTFTKKTNISGCRTKPEHQHQGDIIAVEQHNHY